MSESQKQKLTPVISSGFSIPKGKVPKELLELSGEEKKHLKVLLNDAVMLRAIEYAHLSKPSPFFVGRVTAEDKTDRLSEIRGWDLCIGAIYLQVQTEVYNFGKTKEVKYTYASDNINTLGDDDG